LTSRAPHRRYVYLALAVGAIVALDQASKALVTARIPLYHSIPVIEGLFNLTHLLNPGGAFGFLAGQAPGVRHLLFVVATFLAAGLILYYFHRTPRGYRALAAAFAMILGGAAGNLIDRLRFGQVVDFLDFYIGRYHWPAFNIADSAITLGIGIFVGHLIFHRLPE
jgi:signal peptidase II